MKLTNKYGLPQTIVNAVMRPTYSKNGAHLSVTELINSPRIVTLRRVHDNDVEEDVAERVWSLFGSAVHKVLEQGKDDNHIIEQRLSMEIDGWTISGAMDLQTITDDGIEISDYKVTSVYSVMREKSSWTEQLNCYAHLVRNVKHKRVSNLRVVAILRDWSRREADENPDYPRAPIVISPVTMWSDDVCEAYIKARINAHAHALFASETGEDLPLCSDSDMWIKPTMYAVMKIDGKRASAVFVSREAAEEKIKTYKKPVYEIQVRPGERTRCERFCSVAPFCSQYRRYTENQNECS